MTNQSRDVDAKAIELGKHVLRMTTAAGPGHPSSGLAILHILITLMRRVMRFDPRDPWNAAAARLGLSDGPAVAGLYAVSADLGGAVERARGSPRPRALARLPCRREPET